LLFSFMPPPKNGFSPSSKHLFANCWQSAILR
jgi:hypothetical protein